MPRNQQPDQPRPDPVAQDGDLAAEPAETPGPHVGETALVQLFWAIGAAIDRADPPEISRKNLIAVLRGGRPGYDQLVDYLRRHQVLARAGLDPLALTDKDISNAVRRINDWFGSRLTGARHGEKPFRHHEPVSLSEQGRRAWQLVQETLAQSDGLEKSLLALSENLGYNDSTLGHQLIRDLLGGFLGVGDQQRAGQGPGKSPEQLAAEYDAVYRRLSEEKEAFLERVHDELLPRLKAKVTLEWGKTPDPDASDRQKLFSWITDQVTGLGLSFLEKATGKPARFMLTGKGEFRIVPVGQNNPPKEMNCTDLTDLLPHFWFGSAVNRQRTKVDDVQDSRKGGGRPGRQ